jgi:VWFA-related protein
MYTLRFLCLALLCLSLPASRVVGQQTQPSPSQTPQGQTPQDQPDEVLRISTELVQTDVMVFDKQGRFVDNLKPEQFELKVDGKPQPLSFFERVTAGSAGEEAQLAAARGTAPTTPSSGAGVKPLDRGRTILFFLDDLHLSFESLERSRKSLLRFIDDEMGQNDIAAITSASGRIGFLQQFTGNKAVLRAAVARLKYQPYNVTSAERPPMSEYQALAIERGDIDALGYFIDQIRRDMPGINRDSAETMVRGRARQILTQAGSVTTNTLSTLDSLMRSASRLPGRKLVVFMSDGFFLDEQNGNPLDRLRRITSAATRAGVIIYTMDTRGLVTGMPDASSDVAFDTTGRLSRVNMGEISAAQEALFNLASETGGRALINSNAPFSQIKQAVNETSVYYLLVWRPDPASQHGSKYRKLEISVQGHPELKVRARRGFINEETASATRDSKSRDKGKEKVSVAATPRTADEDLRAAIGDVFPRSQVPTTLSVNYIDLPGKGMTLTLAMQVTTDALDFKQESGKQAAQLNVAGIILNDTGKQVHGFKDLLNVNTTTIADKDAPPTVKPAPPRDDIVYNYQTPIEPGLYQVRVATRDNQSGHTGSDMQWVEIPDLASRRLSMSSLFIGERKSEQDTAKPNDGAKTGEQDSPLQVNLSIDARFARTSQLRFFTYIYNAARGPANTQTPDVALQIQIFRDNQPVLTNALRKVQTDGLPDLSHIPYAAEIKLDTMPPGRYVLQVTAIDRLAKTSATQRINFTVE